MKVFLAGATGAIGRRLVPRLIEAGHHVTAITRKEKKLAELYELGAEPLLCDVFDARKLRSIMARAEPDAVVNELTSATVAALERARPGVYNVVDDDPATATQWMPVYAEALGAKRPPRVPAFVARLIAGRALVAWSLSLRGASNEKIKAELDWRPQYESWRQGFFEDIAAVTPGGVPN
jgi:nucleoside-diphosphate-sugar epimerase